MRCRLSMPRFDYPPTRATWGARCGKSARRVLRGGTGTSDLVASLVPTHQVHPHFLVGSNLAEPIPDPQFTDGDGNVLIPDFVLKPVVAQQRHTKWEILDRSCRLKN